LCQTHMKGMEGLKKHLINSCAYNPRIKDK
jgi:hypothetical protein